MTFSDIAFQDDLDVTITPEMVTSPALFGICSVNWTLDFEAELL